MCSSISQSMILDSLASELPRECLLKKLILSPYFIATKFIFYRLLIFNSDFVVTAPFV
jgi:hypothetical protein